MEETIKYSGKGVLVKCKTNNNGEPLFFWERGLKKQFIFYKNIYYTMISDKGKIFVIDREHVSHEIDPDYFKYLFKIV